MYHLSPVMWIWLCHHQITYVPFCKFLELQEILWTKFFYNLRMLDDFMQPTGKWMCWCLCICSQFKVTKGWIESCKLIISHSLSLLSVFLSLLIITQLLWRVDGTKGTIEVERGVDSGKHGYQVKRPFNSVELMAH